MMMLLLISYNTCNYDTFYVQFFLHSRFSIFILSILFSVRMCLLTRVCLIILWFVTVVFHNNIYIFILRGIAMGKCLISGILLMILFTIGTEKINRAGFNRIEIYLISFSLSFPSRFVFALFLIPHAIILHIDENEKQKKNINYPEVFWKIVCQETNDCRNQSKNQRHAIERTWKKQSKTCSR